MKNKKILFIISCIIIIGLVFGGFVLYQKHRIIELERERMVEVKDLPIEEVLLAERDRHILFHFEACLAGHRPELEPARDIRDKFYVLLEALSQRDKKVCLRLEEAVKNKCLRYFYGINMLLTNNQKYCEKMKDLMAEDIDWQKRCLAIAKNNISLCEEIKDLLKKEICKAIILGPEYCNRLSGYYKTSVPYVESEEGVITRRVEIIEISEQEAKSICRREAYLIKAIKSQDSAICNQIEMQQIAVPICRILSNPDPKQEFRRFHQGFCYEKFALDIARIKNDPSICEKIPAKQARNQQIYQQCINQFLSL